MIRQLCTGGSPAPAAGITLLELLLVLVLTAVLLMVALPLYGEQVIKARRVVATGALLSVAARQQQFMLSHRRYARTLVEMGFSAPKHVVVASGGAGESADAFYELSLATVDDPYRFLVRARPVGPQAADTRCGTFSLDAAGVAATSGSAENDTCW